MTETANALLIQPEELVLLGLALVPEATRYYAIGTPTRCWQSLTTFLVDGVENLLLPGKGRAGQLQANARWNPGPSGPSGPAAGRVTPINDLDLFLKSV